MQFLAFAIAALSPVGGMVAAIPLGMLGFGYPAWSTALFGIAAGYAQAAAVDLSWRALDRWGWWQRWLARRRDTRLARLLMRPGAFFPVILLTPLVGPWAVMALLRWAGVPHRRAAPPILLGLVLLAALVVSACRLAPQLFQAGVAARLGR